MYYFLEQISKKQSGTFLVLLQIYDFSVIQGLVLVSQRLTLLEECFPCPRCRGAQWSFRLIFPSPSRQMLIGKREYQFLV